MVILGRWNFDVRRALVVVALLAEMQWGANASSDAELIQTISQVGPEGAGNEAAAKAWRELASRDLATILPLLTALDSAGDLAANWHRSAIETIVSRELTAKGSLTNLPVGRLEAFVLDRSHQAHAQRFAYELIAGVDSARAEKLIAGMMDDPGAELRREAVARELDKGIRSQTAGRTNEAKKSFAQLLPQARDVDQVDQIAKALRSMGETVDVAKAFGFLREWKVVGPFDNGEGKGFAAIYPPEHGVDLNAEYIARSGTARWRDFVSTEDYGDISMNLPFKALKGVAAYAYTEFHTENAMPVELRLGSQNAFKVWVNGQFLFGQNEYHRNKEIDQYPMRTELKAGLNEILVKVCQNEQTEDWASDWDFQIRICDLSGAPLVSAKGGVK